MSFVAPFFLLGLVAIVLPVWLHRLQTQNPETEPFGSTMLLEASEQRVHLKTKLRYRLLLALRIVLLILLALAFAKPVVQRPATSPAGAGTTLHIIVIDTSFSMSHGDRFSRATATAREIIDNMNAGDQGQLINAGSRISIVTNRTGESGTLHSALGALEPGTGRLDLGTLLTGLAGLLDDDQRRTQFHLISDFQLSGLPARFSDLVPNALNNDRVALRPHPIATDNNANWTVDYIRQTPLGLDVGVRGYNTDAQARQLTLRINGVERGRQSQIVQPGAPMIFHFDQLEFQAGDNRVEARLAPADALAGDDIRVAVVENTPPAPVLLITSNKESLPVTYLSTALETGPGRYRVEPVIAGKLDSRILQRYPWIIIDDLGSVNKELAGALTKYLNDGGAIFAVAGKQSLARQNLPITGHPVGPVTIVTEKLPLRYVARIDTSHPVLDKSAGWRSVRISKVLPLTADARDHLLITLNDASPLLIERDMEQGRLLLLTTSLDNTWSDLPVRRVFVGFISEIARYLSDEGALEREQIAGDFLRWNQGDAAAGQVIDPEGRKLLALGNTVRPQDIELDQTGFYQVYTLKGEALVAVNVDPRESDPAVMTVAALVRWRNALADLGAGTEIGETASSMEKTALRLWPYLLAVLVFIIFAESLLGNRYLSPGRETV